MEIPGSSFAIFAFLLLALPGLVYAGVRRTLKGERPEDRDFGLTLTRVVLVSVLLDSFYFALASDVVLNGVAFGAEDSVTVSNGAAVGTSVLLFGILIPVALALALHYRPRLVTRSVNLFGRKVEVSFPVQRNGYTSIPTAWDFAGEQVAHSFVRIRRADGTWIAGWFTRGSYMSTYPEPRSIFIGKQFRVDEATGEIGREIVGSRGVWVVIGDSDVVEWIDGT